MAGFAILLLLLLMAGGVSVALALGAAGVPVFADLDGEFALLSMGETLLRGTAVESFSAIPLFILLGELLIKSNMAERALSTIARYGGKGGRGLITSGIVGTGAFAAISGSSLATGATVSRLMWPTMRSAGLTAQQGLGPIAAGATLGLMIPPSLSFIIYGSVTGESIGKLFIAGIAPGTLLFIVFLIVARVTTRNKKFSVAQSSQTSPTPITEAIGETKPTIGEAIKHIAPIVIIFAWVLGSIYMGWATPSESAGAACIAAIVLAIVYRSFTIRGFREAVYSTIRVATPLLLLLSTAALFSAALSRSGILRKISDYMLIDLGLTPVQIIIALVIFYLLLGMFMDGISMMVVTLPIIFPIVVAAGFDGVWFGIIVTMLIEIGLITPPIGLNLFVISQSSGESIEKLFKGAIPYVIAMLLLTIVLIVFPSISLWLPELMG